MLIVLAFPAIVKLQTSWRFVSSSSPVRHDHGHRLVVKTAALVAELQNLHAQNVASELNILERGFSADKLSDDILCLWSLPPDVSVIKDQFWSQHLDRPGSIVLLYNLHF